MTLEMKSPLRFMETKVDAAERDRTAMSSIRNVLQQEQPQSAQRQPAPQVVKSAPRRREQPATVPVGSVQAQPQVRRPRHQQPLARAPQAQAPLAQKASIPNEPTSMPNRRVRPPLSPRITETLADEDTPRPIKHRERKSDRLEPLQPQEPTKQAKQPREPGKLDEILAKVTSYRPTKKHLMLGAAALVVLMYPWAVFWTVVFTLFVVVGAFLALGYDGFWRRCMDVGQWYAGRNPSRAAKLNSKLDAFAMKWDTILDRFPDGTVDGLYLPDFGEMAAAEGRHDEALDRRFADLRKGRA